VVSDVVAVSAHLNGVQYPQVLYLVVADAIDELEGLFGFVGFDAADEVQISVDRHLLD
jgi:hypothetical protein